MKYLKVPHRIFAIILFFVYLSTNTKISAENKENIQTSKIGQETPQFILSMAFHYYNEFDYDKAVQFFEKYNELVGEEEVSLVHLGKIYLNLKNTDKALEYFQRALKLDSKNIDTLGYLADIYLSNKKQDEAIKILESMVELDPVNERALFTLAEIYQTKKDTRKSMVYYRKLSLATLKSSANVRLLNKSYTQIARYYYDIQDYEKALEYYEKIIEISPEDYNSLYIYAELLKVNGKFSKSSQVMIPLLKKDPSNQSIVESLIESLFIIDDYQTRSYLKGYLETTSNANSLYRGFEKIYSGDKQAAAVEFTKVLKKYPNRISAHIGLYQTIDAGNSEERKKEAYTIVILAQKVKSYDIAARYMGEVFEILKLEEKKILFREKMDSIVHDKPLSKEEEKLVNEYIDSFYTHAISLENIDNNRQALAYYLQCLRNIDDQLAIIQYNFKVEDYLHSESKLFSEENLKVSQNRILDNHLQKIKSLREKKYETLLNLNWLVFKNKEKIHFDNSKYLRENIEIQAQDPRAYFMNGIVAYETARESKDDINKYKEAKDYFLNAIILYEKESDKKHAPANYYFYLGITYDKLGEFNEMNEQLKKSISLDPYNSVYLNYLGYMYSLKNIHLDDAFEYIKRGLEDDPENDAYLDTLGWIYFKMNQYEEALGQLLVARTISEKKGRKDPVIDFHLAETYKKLGNNNQAIRFYKSALENIQHASEPLDRKILESEISNLNSPIKK